MQHGTEDKVEIERKRRRVFDDSDDEAEDKASPDSKGPKKNKYMAALADSDDEVEDAKTKENDKAKAEESAEEDSGDESDSSHSSQHTNASDPVSR